MSLPNTPSRDTNRYVTFATRGVRTISSLGKRGEGPGIAGTAHHAVNRLVVAIVLVALAPLLAACGSRADLLELVAVPGDAATLVEAHDLVAPGGTILVGPGVYTEQLVVSKEDVTVRGTDRNATIIDGEGIRPYGIVAVADGVRIQNLTVRRATFYGVLVTGLSDENGPSAHTAQGYEPFDPAEFPPVERFAINYVTAHNNGLYGIYAFNSRHGEITDAYASGSADSGFYVGQCTDCNIAVAGNVAEHNAVGFENANASGPLTVIGNRFTDNRVGLTLISNYQEAFTPQRENIVVGNVISDNNQALSPRQESGGFGTGVGVSGAIGNTFANNRIENNTRAGMLFANTEDLPAAGNSAVDNVLSANGVDVANVSAERAPAANNCAYPAAGLSALPEALLAGCGDAPAASGPNQPAVTVADLPAVDVPAGMSFLEVPAPGDQPQMPNPLTPPSAPLPATIEQPDWRGVAVPPADLLADRTQR